LNFLDTKAPLVLLYRDIEKLPDVSRYDLMLTPQFYILKREDLPVKYAHQAKKLAPSILDGMMGEGTSTYEVFREGDQWTFVAYDLQELSSFLEAKGGSIDRVRRIYFAEQAKKAFATPVALNDREALTLVNHVATIVPRHLMDDKDEDYLLRRAVMRFASSRIESLARKLISEIGRSVTTHFCLQTALQLMR